jgi:hypothetical protein
MGLGLWAMGLDLSCHPHQPINLSPPQPQTSLDRRVAVLNAQCPGACEKKQADWMAAMASRQSKPNHRCMFGLGLGCDLGARDPGPNEMEWNEMKRLSVMD